jgi:hypothetical protein
VDGLLASVSPDAEWIAVRSFQLSGEEAGGRLPYDAYSVRGEARVPICLGCRTVRWSADGRFFYIAFAGMGVQTAGGKTIALPIRPSQHLPDLPAAGVKSTEEAAALPGVVVIDHGNVSPGRDPSVYAYIKQTAQRNLYRVPIVD